MQDSSSAPLGPLRGVMQPVSTAGASAMEIPVDPVEYMSVINGASDVPALESACQTGPISIVQSIVSSGTSPRSPYFLYQGLVPALSAGHVEIAGYLLSHGAPIIRQTAQNVLSAPIDQQVPLFELLVRYGWDVNTLDHNDAVLLPRTVDNLPLLRWFLAHGADPNLGREYHNNGNTIVATNNHSCRALEYAAGHGNFYTYYAYAMACVLVNIAMLTSTGNVEAVRLLLDAGAVIEYGNPLHSAARAHPPGTNPYDAPVKPSKEFDESRIPAMALLVQRGADVNEKWNSPYMDAHYAIQHAVIAGAVERVKWLLAHGADPELEGPYKNVVYNARSSCWASEEMKTVIDEWMRARE